MERYLLETCYLLTRDLYQIFITFFAMSFMLKPRYHRAICVSASVLYSFASEQLLLDGPPLLHGVGIALSFFLPALFLYKDKLMYRSPPDFSRLDPSSWTSAFQASSC